MISEINSCREGVQKRLGTLVRLRLNESPLFFALRESKCWLDASLVAGKWGETRLMDERENPGKVVFVTGSEEVVRFEEGDQFFGVQESWLLPRLRLKLELEYIDLFERGGFHIILDNELIEDIDPIACLGEFRGELCTYGDGNSLGGSFNLYDEWVEALAYELFWNLTRIDTKSINLHDLALEKLVEGMDPWNPYSEDLFEVTSPYLKADNPKDVSVVLGLAGYASEVYLNGTLLDRSRSGDHLE